MSGISEIGARTEVGLDAVTSALTGPGLIRIWADSLESSALSMERQVALKKWISDYRDQIIRQFQDIELKDELEVMIALRYIEIRANWNGLNTQLQFQMFRGQEPDPEITVRASLISSLITELEGFIGNEDKDQVDTFLDNPLLGEGTGLVKVDAQKITIIGPNRVLIQGND